MVTTLHEIGKRINGLGPDRWGWGGLLVTETATDAVVLLSMIWNDRIVLLPLSNPLSWEYGWCYDKAGRAGLMAALVWDPDTEDEPLGFKKRVTALNLPPRTAGGRAQTVQ